MRSLAIFQDEFASALLAQHGDAPAWAAQPAFAVYRNTVMKACIDALEANYLSVARLVGRDWFRAAAAIFARDQLPADGVLMDFGEGFSAFLCGFAPAAGLPYLADVARLDRFWTEAHGAADALPVDAARLARLQPESLMECRLAPHPAARWAWFGEQPVFSIWQRNRLADADVPAVLDWHAEGALLTRPEHTVGSFAADRADCAFLDACAQGRGFGDAIEAALQADPQADPGAVLARLLHSGALTADLPHLSRSPS